MPTTGMQMVAVRIPRQTECGLRLSKWDSTDSMFLFASETPGVEWMVGSTIGQHSTCLLFTIVGVPIFYNRFQTLLWNIFFDYIPEKNIKIIMKSSPPHLSGFDGFDDVDCRGHSYLSYIARQSSAAPGRWPSVVYLDSSRVTVLVTKSYIAPENILDWAEHCSFLVC